MPLKPSRLDRHSLDPTLREPRRMSAGRRRQDHRCDRVRRRYRRSDAVICKSRVACPLVKYRVIPLRATGAGISMQCSWSPQQETACASFSGSRQRAYLRSAAEPVLLDSAANPIVDSRSKVHSRTIPEPPACGSLLMWVPGCMPFIGLFGVPFYNFQEPAAVRFPFFLLVP